MLTKKELSFIVLPTLLFDTAGKVIAWLLFASFTVFLLYFDESPLDKYCSEIVDSSDEGATVANAFTEKTDNKQVHEAKNQKVFVENEKLSANPAETADQGEDALNNELAAKYENSALDTQETNRSHATSHDETANDLKIGGIDAAENINVKSFDSVPDNASTAPAPVTNTPLHSLYSEQEQQDTKYISADTYSLLLAESNEAFEPREASQPTITSNNTSIMSSPYSITRDIFIDTPWEGASNNIAVMDDLESESSFETYQMPYNNPVYDIHCTYYPNCTNKKCKFIHPGPVNNYNSTRKRSSSNVSNKRMSKDERIQRQAQDYIPQSKSRCNHWPYCTNNNCKYMHPIKDCRNGDDCEFQKTCMFVHPRDRI